MVSVGLGLVQGQAYAADEATDTLSRNTTKSYTVSPGEKVVLDIGSFTLKNWPKMNTFVEQLRFWAALLHAKRIRKKMAP